MIDEMMAAQRMYTVGLTLREIPPEASSSLLDWSHQGLEEHGQSCLVVGACLPGMMGVLGWKRSTGGCPAVCVGSHS